MNITWHNLQWEVTDTLTMLRSQESTYILIQYKIWSADNYKIWVKVNITWVSSMPTSKFSIKSKISGVTLYVQEKKKSKLNQNKISLPFTDSYHNYASSLLLQKKK